MKLQIEIDLSKLSANSFTKEMHTLSKYLSIKLLSSHFLGTKITRGKVGACEYAFVMQESDNVTSSIQGNL